MSIGTNAAFRSAQAAYDNMLPPEPDPEAEDLLFAIDEARLALRAAEAELEKSPPDVVKAKTLMANINQYFLS